MNRKTTQRMENAGFVETTVTEFLGLSPEEEQIVEVRAALAKRLREVREKRGLTQVAAAKLLQTSQSRIARMEAGASDVTVDLLIEDLLKLGDSRKAVARAIAG